MNKLVYKSTIRETFFCSQNSITCRSNVLIVFQCKKQIVLLVRSYHLKQNIIFLYRPLRSTWSFFFFNSLAANYSSCHYRLQIKIEKFFRNINRRWVNNTNISQPFHFPFPIINKFRESKGWYVLICLCDGHSYLLQLVIFSKYLFLSLNLFCKIFLRGQIQFIFGSVHLRILCQRRKTRYVTICFCT